VSDDVAAWKMFRHTAALNVLAPVLFQRTKGRVCLSVA
jgi:hypothetical protein